jgi:hypothetical protein
LPLRPSGDDPTSHTLFAASLLQRHGVSRLPSVEDPPARRQFRAYPLGYVHIDLAEVSTEEGQLYLFVAIDRVSQFAFLNV